MDINPSLQILGWYVKGTHSLTAVPFVRGHRTVFPRTPRNTCVYTRHSAQCHGHVWRVDTAPGKTRKKTECMLRRPPIGG